MEQEEDEKKVKDGDDDGDDDGVQQVAEKGQ